MNKQLRKVAKATTKVKEHTEIHEIATTEIEEEKATSPGYGKSNQGGGQQI